MLLGAFAITSTAFYFRKVRQWRPLSHNLIRNGDFRQGFLHWQRAGNGRQFIQTTEDGSRARLISPETGGNAVLVQKTDLPPGGSLYRFSFEADAEVYEPKEKTVRPNAYLVYADYLKRWNWNDLRVLAYFEDSARLRNLKRLFRLPSHAVRAAVVIQAEGPGNRLSANNLHLSPVTRFAGDRVVTRVLLVLHFAAFAAALLFLPASRGKIFVALAAVLIALGMVAPQASLKAVYRLAAPVVTRAVDSPPASTSPWSIRRFPHLEQDLGLRCLKGHFHFFLFFAFSILAFFCYNGRGSWRVAISLVLFAFFCESLQFFALSRTPGAKGLLLNGLGILAGSIAGIVLANRLNIRHGSRQ